MEEKNDFMYIAIVAIVAVVAIIVIVMGVGTNRVSSITTGEDVSGQAGGIFDKQYKYYRCDVSFLHTADNRGQCVIRYYNYINGALTNIASDVYFDNSFSGSIQNCLNIVTSSLQCKNWDYMGADYLYKTSE